MEMKNKYSNLRHFEISTDTTSKEFKAISIFYRVCRISQRQNVSIVMSNFGPGHGKFLVDPAGKH